AILTQELGEHRSPAHPGQNVLRLRAKVPFDLHRLARRINIGTDVLNHGGILKSSFIDRVLKAVANLEPCKGLRLQDELNLKDAIIKQTDELIVGENILVFVDNRFNDPSWKGSKDGTAVDIDLGRLDSGQGFVRFGARNIYLECANSM